MAEALERSEAGLEAEEARLARAAAAGDGEAFATLYERYAQRAYNLALRICGSDQDAADAVQEAFLNVMRRLPELGEERELAFGSYLFTATRNATYDLIRRQQRSQPSDSIPESAVPLGAGAGGFGLDPGDPDEDPDRKVLLEAQQEEIAAANARLPERQREALALRELEEMSYDEIAAVMEMNRNSVAQLISRARISLRDELRGTALASVAVSSPDCERALPLIAARDDGQLDADGADAAWLSAHMAGCDTCRVAREAMQEAGASYRAWIPAAVAPWMFEQAMAKAAELSGSDWSDEIERHRGRSADPSRVPGMPAAYRGMGTAAAAAEEDGPRRRRAVVAGALALLLLLGGAVVALSAGGGGESEPAAAPARTEVSDAAEPESAPEPKPVPEPKPDPVEPKQQPKPSAAQAATPEPEPLPVTEATSPAAPPTESKTKASTRTPPAAEPKGGEAGLDGSTARDPQPESPPPSEPPPPPPPAGEEEEPTPPPPGQPPVPGGPGNFKNPSPPGGPVP